MESVSLTHSISCAYTDPCADLELIAFTGGVDEAKRSAHWWGNKQEGLIDWAFLPGPLNADDRVACINRAANSTIYDAPIHGGRTTKEGKKLRWAVAFPLVDENRERRGVLPFFCGDITPRDWRVSTAPTRKRYSFPSDSRGHRYQSGAKGIRMEPSVSQPSICCQRLAECRPTDNDYRRFSVPLPILLPTSST